MKQHEAERLYGLEHMQHGAFARPRAALCAGLDLEVRYLSSRLLSVSFSVRKMRLN